MIQEWLQNGPRGTIRPNAELIQHPLSDSRMIAMRALYSSYRYATGAALAAASLLALPTISQAQQSPGEATYRCTVLGDSAACPPASVTPADRIEVETIPGPYAQYLIHLGQAPETAIAAARPLGEVAVRRTVRISSTEPLTAEEAHERYLGEPVRPEESRRILAEVPIEPHSVHAAAPVPAAAQ
jgi:hypothetical protein